MDFMTAIENNEKTTTTNGATMYKTSGSKLVDINFAIPELRVLAEQNSDVPYERFMLAYKEDKNLALRWLLFLRDVRGGAGERASFRSIMRGICKNDTQLALDIVTNIDLVEYGRWDDWIGLYGINKEIDKMIISDINTQLTEDKLCIDNNQNISLLGKWLPSENTSSVKTRTLATQIRKALNMSPKEYRKTLSTLRKKINIVENNMSRHTYENIDYSTVPSKANIKYRNAFMRNDTERRQAFLDSLKKGETKINATCQFPYDIVNAYSKSYGMLNDYDEALEQMWKNQNRSETFVNTLVVRDGSGSMTCPISMNSNVEALTVATSLAILCSEQSEGGFKDKFITFSANPELIDLSKCNTLLDKLNVCCQHDDCSNTNLEKTFMLILDTAIANNMQQDDLPQRIVVISDMQFDEATHTWGGENTFDATLMGNLCRMFEEYGYKMPKLVFWNCSAYGNTGVPMQENEYGVVLMSGFSSMLFNFITSNEFEPLEVLKSILQVPRYDVVDTIV